MKAFAVSAIVLGVAVGCYGQGTFSSNVQSLQSGPIGGVQPQQQKPPADPPGLVIARNRISDLEKQVAKLESDNARLRRENAALVASTRPAASAVSIKP